MIVVTGGAGFIGSNILAALEERGNRSLVVCDRLRSNDKWRNIGKRELIDVVHPDRLFDYLDGKAVEIEAIIHMGAISATTEFDADKVFENNFRLTMDLWRWCTLHRVRFIYASSAATYGDGAQGFNDDREPGHLAKLRPMNPYGWSKHLFDRAAVRRIIDGDPMPPQWVGLKFFNVYGPNEYHKGGQQSVVAHVYPKAKAGETAPLFQSHHPDYEDGGQMRDFIWVGDCVDVILWLLDNPQVSGIYNVGTGTARPFKDLASAVYRALGKEPDLRYIPTPESIRDKYQYFTEADMGRLRAAGYDKPFTSLEDGVTAYVRDYLDADDPYR
ncbi:ADP-glyceromanno-heptose 6-epimerase [Magnetospira sp. QH-2]|uniref:ADP-glyceromanno-heptose 6-epimerase n=1 Tax=Magnetospira sp. (strain QH-2) TaxID=1288970 RepID=UPI0003E817A1|nr:ADP-glyceromanno-heptose 6-epimerase [Magnetospira sp. QH-2]CCQ72281.1 ADP-L-glycero-D-mannoheptose-6-epimerase [Magnetospira sp. QH-2]